MIKNIIWRKCQLICFMLFSILSINYAFSATFPPAPKPFAYVNDYTQTLSLEHRQILEQKLRQFAKQTSSQIAVVIVPTTEDEAITDYAFQLGDKWGIGRKNLNNGVLMLIAKNDRKVFIATGQGLEGALPDAFLSSVIRHAILPAFKQGQFAQGINAGLDQIINASQGEFAPIEAKQQRDFADYLPLFIFLVFIIVIIWRERAARGETYLSPTQQQILRQQARQFGNGVGLGTGFNSLRGEDFSRRNHDDFGGFNDNDSFGGGDFGGGGAGGSW